MKNEHEFQKVDKIIIIGIVILAILTIIATFLFVDYKYKKQIEKETEHFLAINTNDKYKYEIKDKTYLFYEDQNKVAEYKCINKCAINDKTHDNFIIDNDNYIIISDGDIYTIFNVSTGATYYIVDALPKTLGNSSYGLLQKSNKLGLLNKNAGLALDIEYDDIEYVDGYYVVLRENQINILDSILSKDNTEALTVQQILAASKKNENIFIYVLDENGTAITYNYNIVTHLFSTL